MPVKASVSISEQQDAYARDLVEQGRFSSMSTVVHQGLNLLRKQDEADELEAAALKVCWKNVSMARLYLWVSLQIKLRIC